MKRRIYINVEVTPEVKAAFGSARAAVIAAGEAAELGARETLRAGVRQYREGELKRLQGLLGDDANRSVPSIG